MFESRKKMQIASSVVLLPHTEFASTLIWISASFRRSLSLSLFFLQLLQCFSWCGCGYQSDYAFETCAQIIRFFRRPIKTHINSCFRFDRNKRMKKKKQKNVSQVIVFYPPPVVPFAVVLYLRLPFSFCAAHSSSECSQICVRVHFILINYSDRKLFYWLLGAIIN